MKVPGIFFKVRAQKNTAAVLPELCSGIGYDESYLTSVIET